MRWTVISLTAVLAACSGNSSDHAGTQFAVHSTHHMSKDLAGNYPAHAANEARTFTTEGGTSVTLTKAYAVFESVELMACPQTAWQKFMHRLPMSLFVGHAFAHSEASPTKISEPSVENIFSADLSARLLGSIEPPPGNYCALRVTIGPADFDTSNLPADVNMVGKSVYLQGTTSAGDFTIAAVGLASRYVQDLAFDAPINIQADGQNHSVVIGMNYSQWLNGLAFDSSEQSHALATRVGTALHLHHGIDVEDHTMEPEHHH